MVESLFNNDITKENNCSELFQKIDYFKLTGKIVLFPDEMPAKLFNIPLKDNFYD